MSNFPIIILSRYVMIKEVHNDRVFFLQNPSCPHPTKLQVFVNPIILRFNHILLFMSCQTTFWVVNWSF